MTEETMYLTANSQDRKRISWIRLTVINKQTETDITDIKRTLDRIDSESSNSIAQIRMKLNKVDETKIIKLYTEDLIDQNKKEFTLALQRKDEDFDIKLQNFYKSYFEVEDLIGEDHVYPSIPAFIIKSHEAIQFIPRLVSYTKADGKLSP